MDPNNPLNRKASQETIISLLHLDPTPMDSASIYEKELPPVPEADVEDSVASLKSQDTFASTHSTASLGLSGTMRGPIYYRLSTPTYTGPPSEAMQVRHATDAAQSRGSNATRPTRSPSSPAST